MAKPILTVEIQPSRLRAFVVTSRNKLAARGIFPWPTNSKKELQTNLKLIQEAFKIKSQPIFILPNPEDAKDYGLSGSKYKTISTFEARAEFEKNSGIFKKSKLGLIIELGQQVKLIVIEKNQKIPAVIDLNNMVVNYLEAVIANGESYLLKDYCGANFFLRRSQESFEKIYHATQEGSVEGAELFVEYGAFVGTMIANLENLFSPRTIAITGPLAETYAAWSHSMGKSRKEHLGRSPKCKINILKNKPENTAFGAYLLYK